MYSKRKILVCALVAGLLFTFAACKKNNSVAVTIVAKSEVAINDYSDFTVSIQDLRTEKTTEYKLNSEGKCEVMLDKASYTISISGKVGGASYYGVVENRSITQKETLEITLTNTMTQQGGLIFKQLFFNGETNNGQMMHPDQYIILYNNTDNVVYADGITFSSSMHSTPIGEDVFTKELPDYVVAQQFYAIPGDGTQYPVQPGGQIVIARTAIDHSKNYENAVDLSGADFEIYEPDMPSDFGTDIDNPDVPNLKIIFTYYGIFNMHPRGFQSHFLFRPDKDWKTFLAENRFEFKDNKGQTRFTYKVPTALIMDGIETGMEGMVKTKALPPSVDKGISKVTGCHRQEVITRKELSGKKLQDTNNSTVDCVRTKGQQSFPKKKSQSAAGFYMQAPKPTDRVYTEAECNELWIGSGKNNFSGR